MAYTPHDRRQAIDNAIKSAFGPSSSNQAESDLDQCYRYGTEMNKRVQERLSSQITEWNTHPLTRPSREELFVIIHRLYLDDIALFKPSKDQLEFLVAFNCAKILTDSIFPDV